MKLFRTVLGIDLSGSRIALLALRGAPGGPSVEIPPLAHEFRAEREDARLEEAESAIGEYVARHGLVGAEAFLVLSAERVHMARAAFPPLREKDLREAVGLELDRLFPVPPDTLRYGYMRLPEPAEGGKVSLLVAAVAREYLDRCGQLLSGAGLSPAGSVPSAWAAGAALSRIFGKSARQGEGLSVLLRRPGESVECTVFRGTVPLFCSARRCPEETAPGEGISLALAGLAETSAGSGEPVDLYAQEGWFPDVEFQAGPDGIPFRVAGDFQARASEALFRSGFREGIADPGVFLCAYGATVGGRGMDLEASVRTAAMSGVARKAVLASAVAALLLGIAWPASVALKAREELRRLDRRAAELRPFAERRQAAMGEVERMRAKLAVLQDEAAAPGETIGILKELTDRFPNGTWISSLRIEGRSMEMEGFSPSASELFPALTRDGRFRSVDFGAPIMRQGENLERFKLKGEYVPPKKGA